MSVDDLNPALPRRDCALEIPRLVAIETTNACNAKCAFCPNSVMSRDRQAMSDETFRKIVDDCTTFELKAIEPFLNGEPFMDPQIIPRLQYIRERLPSTKLRLYTNGFGLTDKRVDALLGLGIDHLFISLNTLDAEKNEPCATSTTRSILRAASDWPARSRCA